MIRSIFTSAFTHLHPNPQYALRTTRWYHRNVLVPKFSLPKTGRSISLEVAEPSDFPMFEDYFKTQFHPEPLAKAMNADPNLIRDHLFLPMAKQCLRFPYSVMAMDGEKLVGFVLMTLNVFDEHRPASEVGVEDLGEAVEYYSKDHNVTDPTVRNFIGIAHYAEDIIANYLPREERHVLGFIVLASIAKEYLGNDLTYAMTLESIKEMAKDRICKYFYGTLTARQSATVGPNLKIPEVWKLNFKDIKINGEHVIKQENQHLGYGAIAANYGLVQEIAKSDYLKTKRNGHRIPQRIAMGS